MVAILASSLPEPGCRVGRDPAGTGHDGTIARRQARLGCSCAPVHRIQSPLAHCIGVRLLRATALEPKPVREKRQHWTGSEAAIEGSLALASKAAGCVGCPISAERSLLRS